MPRIRTGYSFRQATGKPQDVINRLKVLGWEVAPITDTNSMFGFVRWTKLCKAEGLRPIYGVEIGVTPDLRTKKKPRIDRWTFIAQHSLRPIHELFELATAQFRYEPLLTYEQATSKIGVTKITGHTADLGMVNPSADLYVGLSPSCARGYINQAKSAGHQFTAISDNRYPAEGGRAEYEVICGRFASSQSYQQHILSDDEWAGELAWRCDDLSTMEEAICNRDKIVAKSTATLQTAELIHPERPAELNDMCRDGAKRLGIDLEDPVYAERLERELRLIKEKDYEDYFYLIADVCSWARERMIVGPARGSSCGSLVCYLLNITTIDPIPYGLIFERFIDINRMDLPDIDIDFSDQQRHLVFEYMEKKFGHDRVARLGSVALYKPRSAINETAAALGVPKWEAEPVIESLLERSSGDSRALQSIEDTFDGTDAGRKLMEDHPEMRMAAKLEGCPRHNSQHAAGVVITQEPIRNYVGIDSRTGAAQCDKKDAEALNLLKIDALGLTQLSIFEYTLELAGLPRDTLDRIPLDDVAAFEVLNKGNFSGIFQFNGLALQSLAKQFTIDRLDDLISITALARPGPLASGGAQEWIQRRTAVHEIEYPHQSFEKHLKDTFGIVIYQEQVMNIGRDIGDLSWGDVTALRKAMSKSLGKEYFDQFGDRWKAGAINKGVDAEKADKVWDDLCAYGAWSFNKSHSVAYGLISYQCCWLKAHHPLEFAAATLTYTGTVEKQLVMLRELEAEGSGYVPVDIDHSTDRWTVAVPFGKKDRELIGPLSNIVGIGPKSVKSILSSRARNEPVPSAVQKRIAKGDILLKTLYPIRDSFAKEMPDPTARNINSPVSTIKEVQSIPKGQSIVVFVVLAKINPRDANEVMLVAKRGFEMSGPTTYLNLHIEDDSGTMFANIDRREYERIGAEIVARGRPRKSLYALKGVVGGSESFVMMNIKQVRYIGEMV